MVKVDDGYRDDLLGLRNLLCISTEAIIKKYKMPQTREQVALTEAILGRS